MKFLEIFSFELNYRKKRPVTYVYFAIILAAAVLTMTSKVVMSFGASQFVKTNSPMLIAKLMCVMSLIFTIITSAVMGVSVLRDFEHKIASLIFITPTKKWQYLLGRFLGSFAVLVGIYLGMLIGFILAEFMPGRNPDTLLAFNFKAYLYPFLFVVLPNILFTASLLFMAGTLSRSMLFVYAQGIALVLIYLILDEGVFELMGNKQIAALLDPMGLRTLMRMSEYWSADQQNNMMIGLGGILGLNRLVWLSVTAVLWFITYQKFSFELVRKPLPKIFRINPFSKLNPFKRRKKSFTVMATPPVIIAADGFEKNLHQVIRQSLFYAKMVVREMPFKLIMLGVVCFLIIASLNIGRAYAGVSTYPLTYLILEAFGRLTIFFLTIIVFYSGELVWKERSSHFDVIYDALPTRGYVNLLSKVLGMVWVFIGIFAFLVFMGTLIQAAHEYYNHEVPLFVQVLSTETLFFVIWFSVLAFVIQVVVNQKFLAYLLTFLVFVFTMMMDTIGLEHGLLKYGRVSLGRYSDMNGFIGVSSSFVSYSVYWFSLAAVLLIVAVLMFVRGKETALKHRLNIARQRLSKPLLLTGAASVVFFFCSGFYIYYNTNILNKFESKKAWLSTQVAYEKTLKQYEKVAQPTLTDVSFHIDIFPAKRSYVAKGKYTLKNLTSQPLKTVHVQHNRLIKQHSKLSHVKFEKGATLAQSFPELYYDIYILNEPLMPNKTTVMSFTTTFTPRGFIEKSSEFYRSVAKNGTFFDNGHFPSLGYSSDIELTSAVARKKAGLPPKALVKDRHDHHKHQHSIMSDDAYKIKLDITLGTSGDQIAIAPGYLQKEWKKNGRNYYHYKMNKPIENFYSIVSARYKIMRDSVTIDDKGTAKKIDLAVYYDPKHQYNLKSMMDGMKHSLRYFSKNFTPYQYRQLRIMEFPRYAMFAQAFANTVPFSESIGFVYDQRNAIDIAFKVTAHEVGHQWWAHQVMGAHVPGAGMILESLAQYSALMVMKHHTDSAKLQKYMGYEHHRYLQGRANLAEPEMPLSKTGLDQNYIQYGKGAVNMYALQYYIGEKNVNKALSNFIQRTRAQDKGEVIYYPSSDELVQCFREVTPDSLQSFVTDLFDKMVLFENKTKVAQVRKEGNNYVVDLEIEVKKLELDKKGKEQSVKPNDWIDVGVFATDKNGKEKLVYLKKHKITAGQTKLSIKVNQKPTKAGVDPLNILMDKDATNNVVVVK